MKRSTIHLMFGTIASLLLVLLIWQSLSQRVSNELIDRVSAIPDRLPDYDPSEANKAHPAVMLKTASVLSSTGEFEDAEALLVRLGDQEKSSPLGMAARFNLANHYLREGLRKDLPGAQTRPLLGIAKQRYRDILLDTPDDWNARVNLEHALRAAPEISPAQFDKRPPVKSVNVVVPDFTLKDLP